MEERNNMCYGVDMSREEWRTKPEWKGYYEFSNWGRCRSLDRIVTYRNGTQRLHKGKVLTPNKNGQLGLAVDGTTIFIQLSKIIAELFVSTYIDGMPISYKDNNPKNCSLDNIIVGIHCCSPREKLTLTQTHDNINGVAVIEGGFSTGQRILFDITIANIIGKDVTLLRWNNIIPNLDNWEQGVDYMDIKHCNNINDYIPLLLELGYTQGTLSQVQHIFIFSERGIAKVMSSLHNSNPAKWEFLNNFVNEYFSMREQLQNPYTTPYTPSNYLEALKQLVKEVEAKELAQKEAKEAKLLAESLKDENTVIKDKLNKMGIKAPYTVTSIQSATKATRTVIVQYMLDNGWVIRRIKDGKPRGFIVVNEDYVAQANGDKVWGIHLTAKGTWHLLEQFKHTQNKLF